MTGLELILVALILLLALLRPTLGANLFASAEKSFSAFAQRRTASVILCAGLAIAARAAALPIIPATNPSVHDDFSFLLASDTFAHGRLANPPHPMWKHFETFHVIWHPTYASMYQPAQGMVLAVGQLLTGRAFWGVCLGLALMCGAICWMLQGWLSPNWALLGGILLAMRLSMFTYWSNSYYGGQVAAFGGALVLGALPRMKKANSARQAAAMGILMGLGLGILANSRPYEGLILSLPIAVALLFWMFSRGPAEQRASQSAQPRTTPRAQIVPAISALAITLILCGAFTSYYFWRVTGSPFRFPYQVNRQTYAIAPYFLWQSLRHAPNYDHQVMENFYVNVEIPMFRETQSLPRLIGNEAGRVEEFWFFFLGPLLTIPLLLGIAGIPYGLRWRDIDPNTRFLLSVFGISVAGLAIDVYFAPHYVAPMLGVVIALFLLAFSRARRWTLRGKPVGLFLTRTCILASLLMPFSRFALSALHLPEPVDRPQTCCSSTPGNWYRAGIETKLESLGGKHLVMVRYTPAHNPVNEWVYNRANIDASPVVWARDMGASDNEELLRYYPDRRIWLVQPDANPPSLGPYIPEENVYH
jgi:hypothetical protein